MSSRPREANIKIFFNNFKIDYSSYTINTLQPFLPKSYFIFSACFYCPALFRTYSYVSSVYIINFYPFPRLT